MGLDHIQRIANKRDYRSPRHMPFSAGCSGVANGGFSGLKKASWPLVLVVRGRTTSWSFPTILIPRASSVLILRTETSCTSLVAATSMASCMAKLLRGLPCNQVDTERFICGKRLFPDVWTPMQRSRSIESLILSF
jgi:hypothetical protein